MIFEFCISNLCAAEFKQSDWYCTYFERGDSFSTRRRLYSERTVSNRCKMIRRFQHATCSTKCLLSMLLKRNFCAPTTKLKLNFHYKASSVDRAVSGEQGDDDEAPEYENIDGGLIEVGERKGNIQYWPPKEAQDATVIAGGNKKMFVFSARRDIDGKREPSVCLSTLNDDRLDQKTFSGNMK